MKWKGIIFDRDGTLFDSLPVILRSFNYGIEPFTEKRPSDAEWFAAFGPAEQEVMETFIPADKKQAAFERFYRYYQEHISEISLFPGIRELLLRLTDAQCKVALFTGGGRTSTRFCLEKKKILSLFSELVTGDDVVKPKPDPEGIFRAMKRMNLQPQETVVVGDAEADVLAGKRAGTATVLAHWSRDPVAPPAAVKADYVFTRISDFEKLIFNSANQEVIR